MEPIKNRIHILEKNFLASVKRKTKLNATLTGLQSEVRSSLLNIYSSLLNGTTQQLATHREQAAGPDRGDQKPVLPGV